MAKKTEKNENTWSPPQLTRLGKIADVAGKETAGTQGTNGKS